MATRTKEDWLHEVHGSISLSRKKMLEFIKKNLSTKTSQNDLRRWSKIHIRFMKEDEHYGFEAARIFDDLGLLQIGSSIQDCYHHTHLIQTFILALLAKEAQRDYYDDGSTTPSICGKEENEELRLERQMMVYGYLTSLIPKNPSLPQEERITLKMIYDVLKTIEVKLNDINTLPHEKKGRKKS